METKVFKAKLDYLHPMFDFITSYCTSHQLSKAIIDQVILAAEEALVNIINYGYSEDDKGLISLSCEEAGSSGIKIVIKDQGIAFDPLKNIPTQHEHNIQKKSEDTSEDTLGGYGVQLLKGLMDVIDYKRVENENVLTMIKYF